MVIDSFQIGKKKFYGVLKIQS